MYHCYGAGPHNTTPRVPRVGFLYLISRTSPSKAKLLLEHFLNDPLEGVGISCEPKALSHKPSTERNPQTKQTSATSGLPTPNSIYLPTKPHILSLNSEGIKGWNHGSQYSLLVPFQFYV